MLDELRSDLEEIEAHIRQVRKEQNQRAKLLVRLSSVRAYILSKLEEKENAKGEGIHTGPSIPDGGDG